MELSIEQEKQEKNQPELVQNILNHQIWSYKKSQNSKLVMLYSRERGIALLGRRYEALESIPTNNNPKIIPMECEFIKNKTRFYFLVADAGEPPKDE
jgi:hypothetical protein